MDFNLDTAWISIWALHSVTMRSHRTPSARTYDKWKIKNLGQGKKKHGEGKKKHGEKKKTHDEGKNKQREGKKKQRVRGK